MARSSNSDMSSGTKKKRNKERIKIGNIQYTFVASLLDSGIFDVSDCTGFRELKLNEEEDTEDNARHARNVDDETTDEEHSGGEINRILKRKRGKAQHSHRRTIDATTDDSDSDSEIHRVIKHRRRAQRPHRRTMDEAMNDGYTDCEFRRVIKCRKRGQDSHDISVSHISIKHVKKECSEVRRKATNIQEDDDVIVCRSQPNHSPIFQQFDVIDLVESQPLPQQQEIFGYYFCEVCNLQLSSEKVYHDHMSGKRHLKNLKLKNVSKAVALSIPASAATEGTSRYPKPPRGVIRKKVKERAKIQSVIKHEVKKPCPGLYLVTEIQGLKETNYYCSACNSICSPNSIMSHLTGFKHQLNLVKHFKPGVYEHFSFERKNEIQDSVISILRAVQKKEGLGRMTVEVEELASQDCPLAISNRSSTVKELMVPSLVNSGMSFPEYYDKATIPDKSRSDFFCKSCDSHMHSEDMWKSHIAGKRHIANLKKMPGERPSRTSTVPLPNARAKLLDMLEEECPNAVVVGLDEVREIQIGEINALSYNCFLCSSCHTSMDIIEHLLSLKHRKKYLDHLNYPYMQYISGKTELGSSPIIEDICAQKEAERGHGTPAVYINRSSFYY